MVRRQLLLPAAAAALQWLAAVSGAPAEAQLLLGVPLAVAGLAGVSALAAVRLLAAAALKLARHPGTEVEARCAAQLQALQPPAVPQQRVVEQRLVAAPVPLLALLLARVPVLLLAAPLQLAVRHSCTTPTAGPKLVKRGVGGAMSLHGMSGPGGQPTCVLSAAATRVLIDPQTAAALPVRQS